MKPTFYLLGSLAGLFAANWNNFSPAPIPQAIEIAGPSVLMNRQREGAIVVDLRKNGRAIPGAIKPDDFRGGKAPVLVGETAVCRRFARENGIQSGSIILPSLLEVENLPGVPQIAPRATFEQKWPIFDMSEDFEFAASRLPNSRRFDFADFRAGKRDFLPKNRPFVVACRVGHRSQLVTQQLRLEGFDARNLQGGLWAWECEGFPVEP